MTNITPSGASAAEFCLSPDRQAQIRFEFLPTRRAKTLHIKQICYNVYRAGISIKKRKISTRYSPKFFLIAATAVIILTFLQTTLANPPSPMPSLPPPTQQSPSQIPPAPTSGSPASSSSNQAQTNLSDSPVFPTISCGEKEYSYGIGAPPQGVSIMIAYTRLKNSQQIKKLEKLGLIKNAVPIVKNTSKKKGKLGISHLPENPLTIAPRFGAWLVYTTLANIDTINKMNSKNTRKRVDFPVTVTQWGDNPSDAELIDFTCIVEFIEKQPLFVAPPTGEEIVEEESSPSPSGIFFITGPDILGRWRLEGGGGKTRSYFEFRESDACVMASIDAVSGKPDPCDPGQYFPYYTEANKVYITEGPSFSYSYTFTKKSPNVLEFIFPDDATKGKLIRMK